MRGSYLRFVVTLACAVCAIAAAAGTAYGQGIYFPAVGAVNQSMGGASTAAPIDALGAMLWNPAAISGLPESEVDVSSAFLIPNIYVGSSSLFGGSGTTRSDSGLGAVANTAVVLRFAEMPKLTIGMASYYAGAGGVNLPGDPTNPVLAPKFPAVPPFPVGGGLVLGPIYSNLIILQTSLQASFQLTDRLSFGFGPVVDTVLGAFDPAFFATPFLVSPAGVGTLNAFPSATDGRPYWGGGFKVGAYYHLLPTVDVGFGYTSPQWIENMVWNSRDTFGNPITVTLPIRLPAVYSGGVSYKPWERLLLAVDCRLIDNLNSTPFGLRPVDGGLGWQDVFVAAVGAQYQITPRFGIRAGYSYNTPVFPGNLSLFNIQAPAVNQHVVSAGFTAHIAENIYASLAYAYTARNTVTGSALQIPGGSTTITADVHSIFLTMTVKFGMPSRHIDETPAESTVSSLSATSQVPVTAPGTGSTVSTGGQIQ